MLSKSMLDQLVRTVLFVSVVSAATAQSLPEMRMTPAEVQNTSLDNNQIGSSKPCL